MPVSDPELQTGTVDRQSPFTSPTPATAANSTTLKQLEAAKARAKLAIGALTTIAGLLLTLVAVLPAVSPVVVGVLIGGAVLLLLIAVFVAYFTNSMTPEEIDALLKQVMSTAARLPQPAAAPSDGDQVAKRRLGPPES